LILLTYQRKETRKENPMRSRIKSPQHPLQMKMSRTSATCRNIEMHPFLKTQEKVCILAK